MSAPLAATIRPRTLSEIIGQDHLVGVNGPIKSMVDSGDISSMILWGDPGTGKTSLVYAIALDTGAQLVNITATDCGVAELRKYIGDAVEFSKANNERPVILFVDELHRLNVRQQDIFLPYVESKSFTFIGATTENPSFALSRALSSRCRIYTLNKLTSDDVLAVLRHAIRVIVSASDDPIDVQFNDGLLSCIATYSSGDARIALNMLEELFNNADMNGNIVTIDDDLAYKCLNQTLTLSSDDHYNLISALHKSIRNSDIDASIFWLAKLVESGEDPMYISRRLMRIASEDIGLADPMALVVCTSVHQACQHIGLPECNVHLTQAVSYLALAPKSNSMTTSYAVAKNLVQAYPLAEVPLHLRNASTELAKDLGYGQNYMYAHDYPDKLTPMECLPQALVGSRIYQPTTQGCEKSSYERYKYIVTQRNKLRSS